MPFIDSHYADLFGNHNRWCNSLEKEQAYLLFRKCLLNQMYFLKEATSVSKLLGL